MLFEQVLWCALLTAYDAVQVDMTLDPPAGPTDAAGTAPDRAMLQRTESYSGEAASGHPNAPTAKRRRDESDYDGGGGLHGITWDGQISSIAKRPQFQQQQQHYTQARTRY